MTVGLKVINQKKPRVEKEVAVVVLGVAVTQSQIRSEYAPFVM